jgi:hypothetical protein
MPTILLRDLKTDSPPYNHVMRDIMEDPELRYRWEQGKDILVGETTTPTLTCRRPTGGRTPPAPNHGGNA